MRVSPNHLLGLVARERLNGSWLGTGLRHLRYRRVSQHVWDHQLWVQLGSDHDPSERGLHALDMAARTPRVWEYPTLRVLGHIPLVIQNCADTLGQRLTRNQRPDTRTRRIHFANLPPKCTISIFSLDGDLVREIIHDKDASDPNASHDSWDLITRNTQTVVSGLYYWTVENTETGDVQIGKLVIIL